MKTNKKIIFLATISLLETMLVFIHYIVFYSRASWWNEPKIGGIIILFALVSFLGFFLFILFNLSKFDALIDRIENFKKINNFIIPIVFFLTIAVFSVLFIFETNIYPSIILLHKIKNHKILIFLNFLFLFQLSLFFLSEKYQIKIFAVSKLQSIFKNHERISVAIILFLLITIFFLPTFIEGKLPINSDYLLNFDPWKSEYNIGDSEINHVLSDSIDSRIPNRGYFNASINNHDFPFWNPNINLGTPYGFLLFTGNFSIANLTSIIAGPAWGTLLYYYLELFILGYFTYLFLRIKNLSILSSILGMIVASFSSYIIAYLGTYVIDSVIYVPVILYFGEYYLKSSHYKYYLGLSLTVMVTLLSGFPAITIYSILISSGYLAFRIISDNDRSVKEKFKTLSHVALGFIAGFLLSLFSLIPTYEFFDYIDLGYRVSRSSQRLPTETIWRIFNGNICGNPLNKNYFCSSNYNETAVYVGLTPILLLPFSLTRRKNFKLAIFFIISLLFIYTTVFGVGNFHKFIGNLPLFNLSPNTRMIALLPICMAIISAISLENIVFGNYNKRDFYSLILYIFGIACLLFVFRKLNPYYDVQPVFITKNIISTSLSSASIGIMIYWISKIKNENWKIFFVCLIIIFAFFDPMTKLYNYNGASDLNTFFPETPGIEFLTDNQNSYERMAPISDSVMVPGFPLYYSLNSLLGRWWTSPEYREIISLIDPGVFESYVTTQPILDFNSINLQSPLINLFRIKYIVLPNSNLYTLDKIVLARQADYNSLHTFEFPNTYTQTAKAKRSQKINKLTLRLLGNESIEEVPVEFRLYIDSDLRIDRINNLVKTNNPILFEMNFDEQLIERHQTVKFEIMPLESSEQIRIYYVDFDLYKDGQMQINENKRNADFAFDISYTDENLYEDYELVYNDEMKIFQTATYINEIPVVFSTIPVDQENCASTLAKIDLANEALVFAQEIKNEKFAINKTEEVRSGTARIVQYSNNYLKIIAELSDDGMIVLSDLWFPGWTAKVDGKDQEIRKVNCIMRGVEVERGNHIIEMRYTPKSVLYGSLFSGMTLISLIFHPLGEKMIAQFKKNGK